MKIQWMWNGIKVDGKLYRARYRKGNLVNFPEDTLTVYAHSLIDGLPNVGKVENNSEMMTDYHETDSMRILPTDATYSEALSAFLKQEEHNRKRWAKRAA